MNGDVRQYYETLKDKDSDKTRYFFDITAENTTSGMKFVMVSHDQNQNKARGADNFKNYAERAERAKYDLLHVTEYSSDGQRVVNNITFDIRRGKSQKPAIRRQQNPALSSGLAGFEQQLGVLGFTDGISGMITASAEKLANEDRLRRQEAEIDEYKKKIAELEDKCEKYKAEAETEKDKCKEMADRMKDMKRDHKFECQNLKSKNSLGALAVQGLLAFASKNTKLGNVLGDLLTDNDDGDDGDDDDEDDDTTTTSGGKASASVSPTMDAESQQYYNGIVQYLQHCNADALRKITTIFQYITIPGKLDHLVEYCRADYQQKK